MTYKIVIERRAMKFISRQSPEQRRRIMSAIYKLPDSGDIRRLSGTAGLERLRVGDYRILFTVDSGHLVVLVVDAGNRGDIYKRV